MTRPKNLKDLLDPTEAEVDFDEFMDSLGDSASVVDIARMERSESHHLDRVAFDDIKGDPYTYLRDRFGVGKYRLRFRNELHQYKGHRTIIIGELRKADGQTPTNGKPDTMSEFMEKQMAMQNTFMLGLLAAIKPAPAPDLGAMMQGLGTIMGAAPKPPDPVALFTALVTGMATLKPGDKEEDSLERARKIMEMAKTFMPDSGPDSWLGVVRDVGKEVVTQIGGRISQPVAIGPGASVIPATVSAVTPVNPPVTAVAVPPGPPQPVNLAANPPAPEDQAGWCRVAIAYLKTKAVLNKDSETIVDMMFECAEEPQWNALLGAVQHGATFDNLLQFDAEIAQNPQLRAWFQKAYDDIHAEIFNAVDTGRTGGDVANPASDADPGAAGPKPA